MSSKPLLQKKGKKKMFVNVSLLIEYRRKNSTGGPARKATFNVEDRYFENPCLYTYMNFVERFDLAKYVKESNILNEDIIPAKFELPSYLEDFESDEYDEYYVTTTKDSTKFDLSNTDPEFDNKIENAGFSYVSYEIKFTELNR